MAVFKPSPQQDQESFFKKSDPDNPQLAERALYETTQGIFKTPSLNPPNLKTSVSQ